MGQFKRHAEHNNLFIIEGTSLILPPELAVRVQAMAGDTAVVFFGKIPNSRSASFLPGV